VLLVIGAVCVLVMAGGAASSATPPAGFIDTTVVGSIGPSPTSVTWDPASAQLFITLQAGDMRVVKDGALLPTPFMHLDVDSTGGRGLLSVALDPNFATNDFLYVVYNAPGTPARARVSRFTAQGDVVEPGSEQMLLEVPFEGNSTGHEIDTLHFGVDGKLYISVGDNNQGAPAKRLDNLLGKVLRMNTDGSIPTDNPFYNTATGNNRLIYAYGFRNPFTFAVQPGTGRIFVNDVGAHKYEEINDILPGANYGWPVAEGTSTDPTLTNPVFCYQHPAITGTSCMSTALTGCAITGGDFYNPPVASFPAEYVGRYFFADMCSGWIAQLDPANGNAVSDFAVSANNPVDIDTGPDGSLYYLEYQNLGRVGRISYVAAPTVTGFEPARGAAGTQVKIDGTYLAGATGVTFNGVPATFKVVWDTKLVATVPTGATAGPIAVTTGAGTASSAEAFGATDITDFSPASGPVGTSVMIEGFGFTGATAVTFGGTAASSYTVDSDAQITAVVAAGTASGPVAVTSPSGTDTSADTFTVIPPPTVSSFTPTIGPAGASVTITGNAFADATAVKFNTTAAQGFTVDSDSQITAVVAPGTMSGRISVTTPAGSGISTGSFTVMAISSISPRTGPAGTNVVIRGTALAGATAVKFHGTNAASYTVDSPSQITAVVAPATTSGFVTVTGPNGTATGPRMFTFIPPAPSITDFTPTSGIAGTSVTIMGSHFTGTTAVKFHGTSAKRFTVNSDSRITAVVRAGSTTGPIAVTNPGGTDTSADSFTVHQPPTISSFSPDSGRAGTTVTILGDRFTGATMVKFHGKNAARFTVVSDGKITAVVMSGTTSGPIVVFTPVGTATSSSSFTVLP
jgi:glucose/arabinose dehydrogenase